MNNHDLTMHTILANRERTGTDIKCYALESFAKEIDYRYQTELLTKLILDYSTIAKQLEEAYEELAFSREVLAEAQKIALLGRWDIKPESGQVTWSESMYDILEIDSSTSASTDLFLSFVHPEDLEEVKNTFHKMITIQKGWTTRYRLRMKSGKIKWVHLRFFSKLDDRGNPIHYYGTIQDVTEMKKVEDELERYTHHLEQMVEEKVKEISSSQMATIYALIKLSESRDGETGAHIERTASFCKLIAQKLQLLPEYAGLVTDKFIDTIYKASPLHDIGKVGIPDSILIKPGKLTDEEFAMMKNHVQLGYDTLAKVSKQYDGNEFLKMGSEIALYHHEKWDGSGYLHGLSGEDIPLSARIMALSDVYDALRSKRTYKDAFSHEKTLGIISSNKGSHFDPALVDVLLTYGEEFRLMYESISQS
jgi:HD-GYP domain-containing protein (c-di-GMP phosphodiesterase class II)